MDEIPENELRILMELVIRVVNSSERYHKVARKLYEEMLVWRPMGLYNAHTIFALEMWLAGLELGARLRIKSDAAEALQDAPECP